ncbi:hypothetical protein RCL_jg17080.t1 [Rhizophagus clarus]|uniref:Retrotransposon gag domain-containing protein n=1 Tax=Rhizophagus clarus TaxID=94130 RepID=A0A8H3LN33_9GLOM|nr:hypothetical protein RCL_jg17080.t1 [Rhizophagus clarus]
MSGLTEDLSKGSSDITTITLEDEQQKENNESNERQATQNSGSTPNWIKDLNPQEQSIFELVAKAKEYFDRSAEPRQTCLVDFLEFKGGNQDPVEWLEAMMGFGLVQLYNRANIQSWNNSLYQLTSFVHAFTDYFCNPFKLNQWKHQLRNRKQKPGKTIEDYIAAIEELWKRVDS